MDAFSDYAVLIQRHHARQSPNFHHFPRLFDLDHTCESGSLLHFGPHSDWSAHGFAYLLADREAKTYALGVQRSRWVKLPEQLEQMPLFLLTYTDARVIHFYLQLGRVTLHYLCGAVQHRVLHIVFLFLGTAHIWHYHLLSSDTALRRVRVEV